jgi:hypothetical protein
MIVGYMWGMFDKALCWACAWTRGIDKDPASNPPINKGDAEQGELCGDCGESLMDMDPKPADI